jgi:hypothetical protein
MNLESLNTVAYSASHVQTRIHYTQHTHIHIHIHIHQALVVQKTLAYSSSGSGSRHILKLTIPPNHEITPLPPSTIELTVPLVMGRDPGASDCKAIAIDCGTHSDIISRQHLKFEPIDGSWMLVDLNSTNGVVVNGVRVVRHVLRVSIFCMYVCMYVCMCVYVVVAAIVCMHVDIAAEST